MREPAEPVLSEMIAQALRQKIIAGELLPGARLSERELNSQLDISRNTLREVFRLLTQEGLLRYQPNRGVCVAVPTDADIIDIYRIRRLIECDALRNAYPYHPAITMMERAVNEARRALREENWGEVGTANMQFHAAIVALSDSERLMRLYQHISAELRLAFGQLADKEMLHSPYVEKNAGIILLLKAGENGNAAATLETYLNISERTILAALARSR